MANLQVTGMNPVFQVIDAFRAFFDELNIVAGLLPVEDIPEGVQEDGSGGFLLQHLLEQVMIAGRKQFGIEDHHIKGSRAAEVFVHHGSGFNAEYGIAISLKFSNQQVPDMMIDVCYHDMEGLGRTHCVHGCT